MIDYSELPFDRVAPYFYVDRTGTVRNRISRGTAKAGSIFGTRKKRGRNLYREGKFKFNGRTYNLYAHRIAYLLYWHHWPTKQISHLDGNGLNNKKTNLEDVSNQKNSKNMRRYKNNTSGITGVYWRKDCQKWQVIIGDDDHLIHIGYFDNFNDAVIARKAAEARLGFSKNHGNIA